MIPSSDKKDQAAEQNDNSLKRENESGQQKVEQPEGLTEKDLPDSDNESMGAMGSGQRQDSN